VTRGTWYQLYGLMAGRLIRGRLTVLATYDHVEYGE